jgi:hypothetical protein
LYPVYVVCVSFWTYLVYVRVQWWSTLFYPFINLYWLCYFAIIVRTLWLVVKEIVQGCLCNVLNSAGAI